MNGRGIKKGASMASRDFVALFSHISKAALIDTLWCACQLGTDETEIQITTQAARNAVIALRHRADRIEPAMLMTSELMIDSD